MHESEEQSTQMAGEARPVRHEHKVLSFVRRSGRLDARLQRAWDTYAGTYLLPLNAAEGSLDIRDDWRLTREWIHDTWGNDHPLIIEIGTGQGENIVAAAAQHPQTNYLALEVYDPGVAHTMLRAGKQQLGNLHGVGGGALADLIAAAPETQTVGIGQVGTDAADEPRIRGLSRGSPSGFTSVG